MSDCFYFAQCTFPASGCRRIEGGNALFNIGENCYVWSSSSAGKTAFQGSCTELNGINVQPLLSGNRRAGLSVRCVQAFIHKILFRVIMTVIPFYLISFASPYKVLANRECCK